MRICKNCIHREHIRIYLKSYQDEFSRCLRRMDPKSTLVKQPQALISDEDSCEMFSERKDIRW